MEATLRAWKEGLETSDALSLSRAELPQFFTPANDDSIPSYARAKHVASPSPSPVLARAAQGGASSANVTHAAPAGHERLDDYPLDFSLEMDASKVVAMHSSNKDDKKPLSLRQQMEQKKSGVAQAQLHRAESLARLHKTGKEVVDTRSSVSLGAPTREISDVDMLEAESYGDHQRRLLGHANVLT